ncbi:unnamed protein product [Triticum turgidum subsp. durum]|uniref:F-box protein AT5G49610-like beta-propeller domain-containing protein n=1 Tax=Triticum turgidum subsp. durum TaxID=4567 RepID=A0A9R1Q7C0_TRITD|nr:unnamed protein product [Triticum turgidum subsp. durum]
MEIVVCAPVTHEQRRVAIPPEFKKVLHYVNGAVLCAARNQGHVHGGCHSSPFKVVLVIMYSEDNHRPLACVYSSETDTWGNLISTSVPCVVIDAYRPGSLVGNALYWLDTMTNGMLEFDLEDESLAMISGPPVADHSSHSQIIQGEDGALGFAILSYPRFYMWNRNINDHGVATWVMWKTVEMHNILRPPLQTERGVRGAKTILGYSEDTDVIFIYVNGSVYMVHLKSMQSKNLHETSYITDYHPFTAFYSPGITNVGGCDGAEVLHDALG